MKLGLVCISELLRQKRPDLAFQTMTRTHFLRQKREDAIIQLSARISHNLTVTIETIKHCAIIGIKHYRLSSSLFITKNTELLAKFTKLLSPIYLLKVSTNTEEPLTLYFSSNSIYLLRFTDLSYNISLNVFI